MGLGAWLAAASDQHYYRSKLDEKEWQVKEEPSTGDPRILEMFQSYGVGPFTAAAVIQDMALAEDKRIESMVKVIYGLQKSERSRSWMSAMTRDTSFTSFTQCSYCKS